MRVPANHWDSSYQILKNLNMGSISFKNMKWKSPNVQFNYRNLKNWQLFSFSIKEIPPTPPHSDSHSIPIPTPVSAHPIPFSQFINFQEVTLFQEALSQHSRRCMRRVIAAPPSNPEARQVEFTTRNDCNGFCRDLLQKSMKTRHKIRALFATLF